MAKWLQFYVKKRRARRTGSRTLGGVLTWLFFALCFFSGVALVNVSLTEYVIPEWRVNHSFREVTCQVLNTRVKQLVEDGSTLYRPDIEIRYTFDGVTYTIWTYDISRVFSPNEAEKQQLARRFVVGQSYPCWVDPLQPGVAVLIRGYTWASWLMLLLPAAFLVVGGGGLAYSYLYWGKSAEHRSATNNLAPSLEFLAQNGRAAAEFPFVPAGGKLTDSPGTQLSYRLPVDARPTWSLVVTLAVAAAVNIVVAVFVTMSIRSHAQGNPDWFLTFFTLPWLAVGGATAYHALRQLLIQSGVGPTIVEISQHPFVPAEPYQIMLGQAGRLYVNSVRLLLICREQATYQQGTNTRIDSRKVYEQEIYCRENFQISQAEPFSAVCSFCLPPHVMHSFKAECNEVQWSFVVQGNLAGWPDFVREFPVIVQPPREPKARA